ncbi:MAG: DUF6194 family protein [Myxococcota bacterium]
MDDVEIAKIIAERFTGVDVLVASRESGAPEVAWGDSFFFYDPARSGDPQRFPFATLVVKDYPGWDAASNLDRPGVFRLNLGVSKETFRARFGAPSQAVEGGHDFTALDVVMPHPVYAAQSWLCVLNPSAETFEREVMPLLADAHATAVMRHGRRDADG